MKLREDGVATSDEGGDDEGAWEGWDVESDSSEESSDGWVSVDSDSDIDLEIGDSEDEADKVSKRREGKGKKKAEDEDSDVEMGEGGEETEEPPDKAVKRISTLATTKVWPPLPCSNSPYLKCATADPYTRGFCSPQ